MADLVSWQPLHICDLAAWNLSLTKCVAELWRKRIPCPSIEEVSLLISVGRLNWMYVGRILTCVLRTFWMYWQTLLTMAHNSCSFSCVVCSWKALPPLFLTFEKDSVTKGWVWTLTDPCTYTCTLFCFWQRMLNYRHRTVPIQWKIFPHH